MVDLLITLVGVAPVVLALLAAVAPPKAEWIRPALLPAVMLQLALTAALSLRHFLFGSLAGGASPNQPLSSEEVAALASATSGVGLPSTLALMAALTCAASAVAFYRHKGAKQALPWAMLTLCALLTDRMHSGAVRAVAEQPLDGGVDLLALGSAVSTASSAWLLPSFACALLAFAAFAWSGWWSRARWTESMMPAMGTALTALAAASTAGAFNAGMKPTANLHQLAYTESASAAVADSYAFLIASVLLIGATVLAAALAMARMLVARHQRVRSTRAMLRGFAWIPLSISLLACMQMAQAPFLAPSAPMALLEASPAADSADGDQIYAYGAEQLQNYLPIAAYGAVFGLALMLAAGPLRATRRRSESSAPPSAAA